MTVVDREELTRESILERNWTADELQAIVAAIQEFQSISVPKHLFSLKQRAMGIHYPVVRCWLDVWRLVVSRALPRHWLAPLAKSSLQYSAHRWQTSFVTTHYDLTTHNLALCPDGRVSILDFELNYYLGDPLFDLCYFVTIPCQPIDEWEFQRQLLARAAVAWKSHHVLSRMRFLLTVCCLSRLIRFLDDDSMAGTYRRNIDQLLTMPSLQALFPAGNSPLTERMPQ